jgi:hypothetical protein
LQTHISHLLFAFCQVEHNKLKVREATLGESQADTVGISRTATAVESESWHLGGMQESGQNSGIIGDEP